MASTDNQSDVNGGGLSGPRKLTKRTLDSLKPRDRAYQVMDSRLDNFGVRVFPSGTKTLFVRYRTGRRSRRFTLGTYGPDFTAEQAFQQAKKHLAGVRGLKSSWAIFEVRKNTDLDSALRRLIDARDKYNERNVPMGLAHAIQEVCDAYMRQIFSASSSSAGDGSAGPE